jgi:hypothetical protein
MVGDLPAEPISSQLRCQLTCSGLRRRAKGDFVDARVHQFPRLLLRERQAVRARVHVDVREMRLDVGAHFDGAFVKEGLTVVEEVDPPKGRAGFVNDAANSSKSSMLACRVLLMPVSGAHTASWHEMLHDGRGDFGFLHFSMPPTSAASRRRVTVSSSARSASVKDSWLWSDF